MTELTPEGRALLLMWLPISTKLYRQQAIQEAGAVEISCAIHQGQVQQRISALCGML